MAEFKTAPHPAAAAAALRAVMRAVVRPAARGAFVSSAAIALAGCSATSWVTTRFTDEAPATTASAPAPAPAPAPAAPAQPSRFVGTPAPAAPAAATAPAVVAAPVAPAAVAARGTMTAVEAAAILADIEPKVEPLSAQGNKPYYAFGRRHTPFTDERPYSERGAIGVIETSLQGKATANGETHDMGAMTAAHLTLPLPSYVRVTNVKTGASTIVRVNDRGPARRDRLIELSPAAADRLQLREGEQVEVVRLLPAEIAQIRERRALAASAVAPAAAPVAAAMPVPAPAATSAAKPLSAPVPPPTRGVAPAAPPAAAAAAPAAAMQAQPTVAVPYPPAIGPVPPGMPSSSLPSAVPGVPAGPTPVGPMPPGAASAAPVAAAAAPGAAARSAAAAPAAGDDLRPGRYSVQVATFAVESNALTLRDRVAGQMKSAGISAPVRVINRNSRAVVAVGDLADKAAADALAEQLRKTLNQDVVVFRR